MDKTERRAIGRAQRIIRRTAASAGQDKGHRGMPGLCRFVRDCWPIALPAHSAAAMPRRSPPDPQAARWEPVLGSVRVEQSVYTAVMKGCSPQPERAAQPKPQQHRGQRCIRAPPPPVLHHVTVTVH